MIWISFFVAVLLWWLMTGLALLSVHRSRRTQRIIFTLVTLSMVAALFLVEVNAARATTLATITGFAMGLGIWGWLELSYLMGFITGPVKEPAAAGAALSQGQAVSASAWDNDLSRALGGGCCRWRLRAGCGFTQPDHSKYARRPLADALEH